MEAAGEIATAYQAAGGLASAAVYGLAEGVAAQAAPHATAGPAHGHAVLDPPGARSAQRPGGHLRKRVRECGTPPVVARAVRPMVAKPIAIAPSAALRRALAAQVQMHSTATALEDIFVQSAAVVLSSSACGRPDRGARSASGARTASAAC